MIENQKTGRFHRRVDILQLYIGSLMAFIGAAVFLAASNLWTVTYTRYAEAFWILLFGALLTIGAVRHRT